MATGPSSHSESGQRGGLHHSFILSDHLFLVRTSTCPNPRRLIMSRLILLERPYQVHPSKRAFKAASHTIPQKESPKTSEEIWRGSLEAYARRRFHEEFLPLCNNSGPMPQVPPNFFQTLPSTGNKTMPSKLVSCLILFTLPRTVSSNR
jgi:hypothetical protein